MKNLVFFCSFSAKLEGIDKDNMFTAMQKEMKIELLVYAVILVMVWFLAFMTDAMDVFYNFLQTHEQYEVDELVLSVVASLVFLAVFSWRRTRALVKTKQKLKYAEQARSAFLSHMSHHIRTPMNGVIGTLGLLKETSLDEDQQHYVELLEGASIQTLIWLADALELASLDSMSEELVFEPADLRNILNQVRGSHISFLEHHCAHLHIDGVQDDVSILVNAPLFQRALSSFATVLIQQGSKTQVFLSAEVLDEEVVFRLSDAGPELPKDIQTALRKISTSKREKEIFDEIYQILDVSLALALVATLRSGGCLGYHVEQGQNYFSVRVKRWLDK